MLLQHNNSVLKHGSPLNVYILAVVLPLDSHFVVVATTIPALTMIVVSLDNVYLLTSNRIVLQPIYLVSILVTVL